MAREVLQQHGSTRDYDRAEAEEREREELRWPGKRAVTDEQSSSTTDERGHDMGRLRMSLLSMDGGGSSLQPSMANQFGGLLGADLSSVRVHTSGAASQQAQSMGAQAFTHGSHIAFAPGQDPSSSLGRHILAHELVHVVQNQRSGGQMQLAARMDVGPSGSDVESEAEMGAAALLSNRSFSVQSRGRLPGISMFSGETPAPTPQPAPQNPGAGGNTPAPTPTSTPSPTPQNATPTPTPGPQPTAAPTQTPAPGPSPQNQNAPQGGGKTPSPSPSPTGGPRPAATPAGAPAPSPSPGPKPTPAPVNIDAKVKEVLEQRADPKSKADYSKAISQVQVLRIQALGYTFTNQNIGNTLFQALVCPTEAIKDHWGQIYSNNAYKGGDSAGFNADTLQRGIESLRGVLHIIGDVSAMISGWAGMVAMVSGLLALITSETVVGGIGFGAIAAAADSVATITGLIKLMCDVIDMILGIVQIVILIIRARSSKDPAARARFAALLKKESGDLAANVTSVAMQVVVMAATAGAGTAIKKMAGMETSFGKELNSLINPKKVFEGGLKETLSKFKYAEQGVGKNVATGGRRLIGAEVGEEATVGISRLKRAANGRVTKVREVLKFEPSHYAAIAKNQMKGAKLVQLNGMMKYIAGKGAMQTVSTVGTAQLIVITRAPSGPSTPSGGEGGAKVPAKPTGALTTVNMWPSQLEAFKTAKEALPAAIERTEEQYEAAKEQAGEELAHEVDEKLKQVLEASQGQTETAGAVTTDANEGKANSDKGAAQAGAGKEKKAQADSTNTQINAEGQKTAGQADQMHPPPPKDGVLGWIYNHTIGKIGEAIGSVQTWIRNFVGKLVMSCAGFSKEELDMAGIENDMRTSATQDTQAQQDAAAAAQQATPLQQKVYELQRDKTTAQQQAIQGMADAMGFIHALEEAEKQLDGMIESGNQYVEAVTPIIRHELEVQVGGKPIDSAYLAPILGYADAFSNSLDGDHTGTDAQNQANGVLDTMHATFPALNVESGKGEVGKYVAQYNTAYTGLANKGKTEAAKVKTAVGAFAGTTDYDGVNANAAQLDHLAAEFDKDVAELQDKLYAAVNQVLQSYETQIDDAIKRVEAMPDDPNATSEGTTPGTSTSTNTPGGSGQSEAPRPTTTPNPTSTPAPAASSTPNPQPGPTATPNPTSTPAH